MGSTDTTELARVTDAVVGIIREITDGTAESVTADSPLVGEKATIKSRQLVEVLLNIEEYAEEKLGVAFSWTGDSAMSQRRSIFRTPRSLAEHLVALKHGPQP